MITNKKGFTLIELLVTIVILGLLVTLGYVSVRAILDRGNESYYRTQEDMLILAGRDYFADYRSKLPKEIGETTFVTLKTLIDEKYIDPIIDENEKDCDVDESRVTALKVSETEYQYYGSLVCDDYKTTTDETDPIVKFTPNKATSQETITVTMKVTDNEAVSKYRYVITKDGEEYQDSGYNDYTGDVTINLTEIGLYEITGYARDTSNNTSSRKSGKYSINKTINCGDVTFTSNLAANAWHNKDINVNIEVPENTYRYETRIKKDNGEYEIFNTYIGSTPTSIAFNEDGRYNIEVELYDSDGNSCVTTSNSYNIDKTRPTLSYDKAEGSYAQSSLTVCATAKDNIEVSRMRMEILGTNPYYVRDEKTNKICYTLSGYGTYTIYTKAFDAASNQQSKNPENPNGFYYQTYTLYNPDPDINFSLSCGRTCWGPPCSLNGYNNDSIWAWTASGAGSGINTSASELHYSTHAVTNYCNYYSWNAPWGDNSGCGYAVFSSSGIQFSRSYANSNIVGRVCTNNGKCRECTVYN